MIKPGEDLRAELEALSERMARLEAMAESPDRARDSSPILDEEQFWALTGLQSQLNDHPSTVEGAVMLVGSLKLPDGTPVAWQQAAGTAGIWETEWSDQAAAFSALGHPVRLELLRHILSGTHATADLAEVASLGTTGQLHHHLRQLVAAGWVKQSGRGNYEVPAARIVPLLACLVGGGAMKRAVLALYRVRIPLYYLAAVVLIGNAVLGRFMSAGGVREVWLAAVFAALALAGLCLMLVFLAPRLLPDSPVRVVEPPVRGRWLGMNSPASKVPSHGVRAYGQAYAIDIVADPVAEPRPEFGGAMMRLPSAYPAFGEPVFAMVDGEVVRASGWRRDHRARSNGWGIVYMMIEGMIREIGGPGFVIGNHVTIRSGDGAYATVAHLQQGSLTVKVGDRVTAGTVIGGCGNSGNTSEPHVHAQLMDRASLWTAQGLPMSFSGITLDNHPEAVDALPANEQHMTATGERHEALPR